MNQARQNLALIVAVLMFSVATTFSAMASAGHIEHYTMPQNVPLNLPFSEAVRVGNTIYLSG